MKKISMVAVLCTMTVFTTANGSAKTSYNQNTSSSLPFSIWLVPSQSYSEKLSAVITELAANYQAASFEPHVTLFSGTTTNYQAIINAVKKISAAQKPFKLTISGIGTTTQYYKTVFISFANNARLTRFQRQIRRLDPSSHYQFKPHLSLLYQHMPLNKKQQIAKNIVIPFKEITFNQIVVMSASNEESNDAVKNWKYLYRGDL